MLHSVSRPLSAPPRSASIPNGHRSASASRLSRSPAPPPSTGPASVELRRPRAPAGDLVCWLRLAPVALPCLRTASSADPAPRRRPHPSAPPQPRRAPLPTDCELRWPRAPTGDLVRWLRLAPAVFSCSRTASSAGPAPRRVPLLADLELRRTCAPPVISSAGSASPPPRASSSAIQGGWRWPMRLPAPCSPAKRQAAAAAVEMAAAPPCSLLAGQEAGRQRRRGGRWPCASLLGLPEGDGWGRAQWSAGGPRVYRVYPNPNPKLRVPELSGSDFSELKSGSIFYYPNFILPELPDPKNSGNPNAQS